MIIPDYICTRNKLISGGTLICLILGVVVMLLAFYNQINLYEIISEYNIFICSLLGFTLASFTLFLSNEAKIKELKSFKTKKQIGSKNISLYRLVCIDFSFLLYVETVMCILYFASQIFNPLCCIYIPKYFADICNSIYVFMFFSCIRITIHTINDIYNIASKE